MSNLKKNTPLSTTGKNPAKNAANKPNGKATARNKGISLIKKSNDLIESRYNFTIWEMRIFLMLIAQIRREDDDFRVYRISYREVAKVFKLNAKRGYSEIRDAARSLLDKKFYVDLNVDGFKRKEIYHLIRKIGYLEAGQENREGVENQEYIDVKIEDEMKPLLLQLQKSFTAYELGNVVHLGVYAVRIYELLKQYESIGSRTLGFEEMKTMFELEEKYPLFSAFYTFLVEPAVREINEHTDIFVDDMEKIKDGKRITAIKFRFRRNSVKSLPPTMAFSEQQTQIDFTAKPVPVPTPPSVKTGNDERFTQFYTRIVENLGITPSVLMELLPNHTDDQIEQAIRVTNRAKIEGQIKSSAAGFFIQALKRGFTDPKEELLKKEKRADLQRQTEAELERIEVQKQDRILDRIRELTQDDPELTPQAIEAVKQLELGQKIIRDTEIELKRPLEVSDFRTHRNLRIMVIDALFEQNRAHFEDIMQDYEQQKQEIKSRTAF
jgi:plasmid replication initiation protein